MKQYSEEQMLAWEQLREVAGDGVVEAMKSLYEIYKPEMVEWFAGLYDASVGGYYYSNSARDGESTVRGDVEYRLMPDAESTYQALSVWYLSGMMDSDGKDRRKSVPPMMQRQIVHFIKSMQDPETGFFYHPQWGKEFTDNYVLRRARDLCWSTELLSYFDSAPTYDAPNGVKGDGKLADGTRSEGYDPFAPKEEKEETAQENYFPPHLENAETFMQYLLDLEEQRKGDFYGIGSQLTSESPQTVARDKVLAEQGADYRLMDIACDWLDSKQQPDSGHWSVTSIYNGINSLLKISGVYLRAKREILHAEEAIASCIEAILADIPNGSIVELYNPWNAISNVISNIRQFGGERELFGEVLSAEERVERMIAAVREMAPETIAKTKEKVLAFAKPDGSFSYCPTHPARNSCGMPVVDQELFEGDINATHLASTGLLSGVYGGLCLSDYKVPIFGEVEQEMYLSLLMEKFWDVQL